MTRNENRQRIKNEAFNKIAKIYDHRYKFAYDEYDEATPCEQREFAIRRIVEDTLSELKNT